MIGPCFYRVYDVVGRQDIQPLPAGQTVTFCNGLMSQGFTQITIQLTGDYGVPRKGTHRTKEMYRLCESKEQVT